MNIGVIGCGNISSRYLANLKRFEKVNVVACADLDWERAMKQADKFGVKKALRVPELLEEEDIDLVLNLTTPQAHAEITLAALEAGKHVYSEKPLAIELAEGKAILKKARQEKRRVGCAPDTFLGAGLQTCRKLIDEGVLGEIVGVNGFFSPERPPEEWHPDPAFLYQKGAGPLMDMGPYYLTAMVSLLGCVHRVGGMARRPVAERVIGSGPKCGQAFRVEEPTHVLAALEFASGVQGMLMTSFDARAAELPWLQIFGSKGVLHLPDPNTFGGPVRMRLYEGRNAWQDVALTHEYAEESRGLGAADMAAAIAKKREHRASGELAYHVLDVMHGILDSASEGVFVKIESEAERPEPLPVPERRGRLDV